MDNLKEKFAEIQVKKCLFERIVEDTKMVLKDEPKNMKRITLFTKRILGIVSEYKKSCQFKKKISKNDSNEIKLKYHWPCCLAGSCVSSLSWI